MSSARRQHRHHRHSRDRAQCGQRQSERARAAEQVDERPSRSGKAFDHQACELRFTFGARLQKPSWRKRYGLYAQTYDRRTAA